MKDDEKLFFTIIGVWLGQGPSLARDKYELGNKEKKLKFVDGT